MPAAIGPPATEGLARRRKGDTAAGREARAAAQQAVDVPATASCHAPQPPPPSLTKPDLDLGVGGFRRAHTRAKEALPPPSSRPHGLPVARSSSSEVRREWQRGRRGSTRAGDAGAKVPWINQMEVRSQAIPFSS